MRILGLDLGKKRIGLALGDTHSRIAVGLPTMLNNRHTPDHLRAVITSEQVKKLIVGLPRTMSGVVGAQASYTQKWAHELGEALQLPVEFEDERLSSKMARDGLIALGEHLSKADIDQAAAVLILQSYLDKLQNGV